MKMKSNFMKDEMKKQQKRMKDNIQIQQNSDQAFKQFSLQYS